MPSSARTASIEGTKLIQAKGFPYALPDLLHDPALVEHYRNGCYVTLRITSSMYHRFHAPHGLAVEQVTYISGDTWNVNPVALKRVENLFCKNERAVIRTRLDQGEHILTLVPVAAVLVASIRLHFLDLCSSAVSAARIQCACNARCQGRRNGLVPARLDHHRLRAAGLQAFCPEHSTRAPAIRMGEPLLRLP
jgi:phosphatidylserine decarboxylase